MIRVLFFASLRDALGCTEVAVPLQESATLSALRKTLAQRFPDWSALEDEQELLVAVNQAMIKTDSDLNDGDEVAFFPPVTGG